MNRPYSPPDGYFDLPFSWVYDANSLTDARDYQNQFVYIQGGYGEFILRRAVGFSRVLEAGAGTFRIYDGQGRPLASDPIFVPS